MKGGFQPVTRTINKTTEVPTVKLWRRTSPRRQTSSEAMSWRRRGPTTHVSTRRTSPLQNKTPSSRNNNNNSNAKRKSERKKRLDEITDYRRTMRELGSFGLKSVGLALELPREKYERRAFNYDLLSILLNLGILRGYKIYEDNHSNKRYMVVQKQNLTEEQALTLQSLGFYVVAKSAHGGNHVLYKVDGIAIGSRHPIMIDPDYSDIVQCRRKYLERSNKNDLYTVCREEYDLRKCSQDRTNGSCMYIDEILTELERNKARIYFPVSSRMYDKFPVPNLAIPYGVSPVEWADLH